MKGVLGVVLLSMVPVTVFADPIEIPIRNVVTSHTATRLTTVCVKLAEASKHFEGKANLDATSLRSSDAKVVVEQLGAARKICALLTPAGWAGLDASALTELRKLYDNLDHVYTLIEAGYVDLQATENGKVLLKPVTGTLSSPLPGGVVPLSDLQSHIINGLADFVVSRAKAEAALYLRDKLVSSLCTEKNRKYVENICDVVDNLSPSVSLHAIGKSLIEAARADVLVFPDLLLEASANDANGGVVTVVRVGWSALRSITSGHGAVEVISGIARADVPYETTDEVRAVKITSVVAGVILAQDAFPADSATVSCFVAGVLLETEARLKEEGLVLPGGAGHLIEAVQWKQLLTQGNAFVSLAKDLADHVRIFRELVKAKSKSNDGGTIPAREVASLAATAVRELVQFGALLQKGLNPNVTNRTELAASFVDAASALAAGDLGGTLIAVRPILAQLRSKASATLAIPEDVQKFLPLIAELGSAKSSEEVTKILEAAAAPVGSYRMKYERPMVSLTALLGGAVGYEYVVDVDHSRVATVFTPIGFHASRPAGPMHIGAMLSLVDLGTLTSARLEGEVAGTNTVEQAPNLTVAQVFSPGAYVVLGLFETPLVFGLGANVVPGGRKVTKSGETEPEDTAAVRIVFFLAVDVTIFAF